MTSGAGAQRETEIKLRIADAEAARELLERAGFQSDGTRTLEADTVFDTPAQVLRRGGRLLRVRRRGDQGILTFKGPATPGRHKDREELETPLRDPDNFTLILTRLGYQVSFRYEKYRTAYRRPGDPGIVTIDETPIGSFLELEGSGTWIDQTAAELGFSDPDYITDSYASLYLAWCRERKVTPGDMIFRV
jgi:adenylate cyclase, class 2